MDPAPAKVTPPLPGQGRAYLDALTAIEGIAAALGTNVTVWGGLSLDIYQGRFLRAHSDIDAFVLDLRRLFDPFAARLAAQGWEVRAVLDRCLLWARRDAVKLHLGHVQVEGDTVEWKHNGDDGSLWFPVAWLHAGPVPFLGRRVRVVQPELGYVLKTNPHLMNPAWVPRDKDRADVERLRALLAARQVDLEALPHQIGPLGPRGS